MSVYLYRNTRTDPSAKKIFKSWHMVSRNTRNATRAYARFFSISVHGVPRALSTVLPFLQLLQRLKLVVGWGITWSLDTSPLGDDLSKSLGKIPERTLLVVSGRWCSSDNHTCQVASLQAIVNFTCLEVEEHGAYAGAAVRDLSVVLAGSLRRLVCTADAWLCESVTWCCELAHVEELNLRCDVPNKTPAASAKALQGVVNLPRLRKLQHFTHDVEAWRAYAIRGAPDSMLAGETLFRALQA